MLVQRYLEGVAVAVLVLVNERAIIPLQSQRKAKSWGSRVKMVNGEIFKVYCLSQSVRHHQHSRELLAIKCLIGS